ncbi:MAG: MFS transporter [Chloroflexi bacterium]|nr:MFS transporter [Chloroflexota bacterium]
MFSRFKAKRAAYSVYLFSEFTLSLLFSMMFVVDGVYQVSTVGLNALQLVLVGTTLEISAFLFEVPTGVIADVVSRRLSIIIGMFVMGLGFVIEGSFPFFAPILLAQVIWGLGYTFTSGATEAWIADEVGEERAGKAFLRASQIGTIGSLIGIGAGTLIGTLGVQIPIVLGGLGSMTGTVVASFGWAILLEGVLRLVLPQGSETWRYVVYPIVLLLVMLLLPKGLIGDHEMPFLKRVFPPLRRKNLSVSSPAACSALSSSSRRANRSSARVTALSCSASFFSRALAVPGESREA